VRDNLPRLRAADSDAEISRNEERMNWKILHWLAASFVAMGMVETPPMYTWAHRGNTTNTGSAHFSSAELSGAV
jgi:hypothetical protein